MSDSVLINQLNAFMRSAVAQWTWDQLSALGHDTHVEQRGPESNPLIFSLYLLENEPNNGRRYLHVRVSAYDFRDGKVLGSAFAPLCNSFIYFQDGELDIEDKVAFE